MNSSVYLLSFVFVVVCFFAEIAIAESGYDCSKELIATKASVVKIHLGENNFASGVVVAPNRVLTVLHAFPVNSSPVIEFEYHHAVGKLIASHHGYDLALIEVNTTNTLNLKVSESAFVKGDEIAALSFPNAFAQQVEHGKIVSQNYKGLLTSARIEPGSSGGALLYCNEDGLTLSGLIRSFAARFIDGKLTNTGHSWVIPNKIITQFLKNNQVEFDRNLQIAVL